MTTTDNCQSWTEPTSETYTSGLNDVILFGTNEGIIVGNDARVLKTTDGGETWNETREQPYQQAAKIIRAINYPNPFNSQTVIEFSIPADSRVSINMYDVTGKPVSEIINKEMNTGQHKINFDSKSISSDVYFYTINAAGFSKTMKMIVVE